MVCFQETKEEKKNERRKEDGDRETKTKAAWGPHVPFEENADSFGLLRRTVCAAVPTNLLFNSRDRSLHGFVFKTCFLLSRSVNDSQREFSFPCMRARLASVYL